MAMTVTTDDNIEWSDKYSHNAQVTEGCCLKITLITCKL